MLAIAAELRMHPGDLVAEARERPARVGALYDSLARERARRFGKDRQVGIEPDPTQLANAKRYTLHRARVISGEAARAETSLESFRRDARRL